MYSNICVSETCTQQWAPHIAEPLLRLVSVMNRQGLYSHGAYIVVEEKDYHQIVGGLPPNIEKQLVNKTKLHLFVRKSTTEAGK